MSHPVAIVSLVAALLGVGCSALAGLDGYGDALPPDDEGDGGAATTSASATNATVGVGGAGGTGGATCPSPSADTPYFAAVIASAPQAVYRFETLVEMFDDSGHCFDGAFDGSPALGQGIEPGRSALEVAKGSGTRGQVALTLPDDAQTVEAWIRRPVGNVDILTVFDLRDGNGGGAWVYLNTTADQLVHSNSGDLADGIRGIIPYTDQWQHIAVTRAGNQIAIFVDGVSVAVGAANGAAPVGAVDLVIGDRVVPNTDHEFDGFIDEVAVYPRALMPTELAAHVDALR